MRAEMVAAALTAKGVDHQNVGRSTRPYDEKAAYLARLSKPAMLFVNIAYLGEDSEANVYRLYLNVLMSVSKDWQSIGTKPSTLPAIKRWKERNGHLIEKMTRMALAEMLNAGLGLPNKAQWRADQLGLTERRWFQAYKERYDKISNVMSEWNDEFFRKVSVNQIQFNR